MKDPVDRFRRLSVGVAAAVTTLCIGLALLKGVRKVQYPPKWWLAMCWFASAALAFATHLALDIVLIAFSFDTMADFQPGSHIHPAYLLAVLAADRGLMHPENPE